MATIGLRLPLFWNVNRHQPQAGPPADRPGLQGLDDRLLRDIGVEPADLAYRAQFWPFWRPPVRRG